MVEKILNDTSVIIADTAEGTQKRVSFNRLKQFNQREYIKYGDLILHDENYEKYQKDLLKTFKKAKVNVRNKEIELDYRDREKVQYGKIEIE